MAAEGSPVCGGIILLHTESDGKHSYEVNEFLNHNNGMFTRKGDKLLMVNNTNVEDLTPGALAESLTKENIKLTIHQPCKKKPEECTSEELRVNNKEKTIMNFSLTMVRESELEAGMLEEPSASEGNSKIPDGCENDDDLVIVSMEDASFNLLLARGCDPNSPCKDCGTTDCQQNEVAVQVMKAEITCNPAKILEFASETKNLFLKSFPMKMYVTPTPITIYTYWPNSKNSPGVPVVLNFTNTQNFICCTSKQGVDEKILTIVTYKKSDLKNICAEDHEAWSLVFYKSGFPTDLQRFESALHRGWFIYTKNVVNNQLAMCKEDSKQESKSINTFFILIKS
ncbi:hypothetical protein DNTS_025825 [Danionella cerebrum]|uniref:Interleukin-1 beta n=1 Tax=Danionella cerebrum TaxID=2873325 RepID=A0A553NA21_9TELE|nr:hypothetical protein DNTS_025825 [Danionella translucida]